MKDMSRWVTNQTGGASAKHEHGRAHLRGDLVQTVRSARRRLQERGVHVRKVLDLEDATGRIGAVLGKTAIHRHSVGFKVLAEELLSASAVEAFSAEFGVVSDDAVPDLETFDLGADRGDNADSLMS